MYDLWSDGELPLGLGMALARDSEALAKFGRLSPDEQQRYIERTHAVDSREGMRQLVREIGQLRD